MRETMIDVLACPVCRSYPLRLKVVEIVDGDVTKGDLSCPTCGRVYPIVESIPNMIPPEIR